MFILANCFAVDGTSASLSCLQGVVAPSQVLRNQGPSLTPSLANYVRADLIAHVMNWPAEMLEKQASLHFISRKNTLCIHKHQSESYLIFLFITTNTGANIIR